MRQGAASRRAGCRQSNNTEYADLLPGPGNNEGIERNNGGGG
jgi:hypothetical protein